MEKETSQKTGKTYAQLPEEIEKGKGKAQGGVQHQRRGEYYTEEREYGGKVGKGRGGYKKPTTGADYYSKGNKKPEKVWRRKYSKGEGDQNGIYNNILYIYSGNRE